MKTRLMKIERTGVEGVSLHFTEGLDGQAALEHWNPVPGDWIVLNPDGTYEEFKVIPPPPSSRNVVVRKDAS